MTNISIKIYGFITGLLHREEGQDLIEYALIGGGVAIAITLGFLLFDEAVAAMVQGIADCIDFNSVTACP